MKCNRKVVLENGMVYEGIGIGSEVDKVADLVFNTTMVGYQEVISDPCNLDKIILLTYPSIGNFGIIEEDFESKGVTIAGLIVYECNNHPSNYRYTKTLEEVMVENNLPGITGVDTRQLMKMIQQHGAMKCLITNIDTPLEQCMNMIQTHETSYPLIDKVSSKKICYARTTNPQYDVVAIDYGIKNSMIKTLNGLGCNVIIVPYNTSIEKIKKFNPDGIFLSSGPGSYEEGMLGVNLVKEVAGKIPLFGVGLGYQVICAAFGGEIEKNKSGHHGSNYPVRNHKTNGIEITTQNHQYSVVEKSLKESKLMISHTNVIDQSIEGVENQELGLHGVQFHPTGVDSLYLFDQFIENMKKMGGI